MSAQNIAEVGHTRTPWRLESGPGGYAIKAGHICQPVTVGYVAHTNQGARVEEANARFICRAVNSHADLLAALEAALPIIASDYEAGAPQFQPVAPDRALQMIRAAIAKARANPETL